MMTKAFILPCSSEARSDRGSQLAFHPTITTPASTIRAQHVYRPRGNNRQ